MERQVWDERYSVPELIWSAGPNRFLVEEVADLAAGRALDVGAGEGRNAIWLASRGWQVTGVDFSRVALAKAASRAADQGVTIDWVEADLRGYQPERDRYDLVLIAYIHLPLEEFVPLLRAAASALAPGGTLLVVGHDADNLARGYGGPRDPALLHHARDIAAALPGLTIRRAGQVRRPVLTDDGERVAIDTLVRAERP